MRLHTNALTTLIVALLVASVAVPASGALGTQSIDNSPQSPDFSTQSISGSVEVTVIDVTDGDTIDVRYDNGSTDTVRLLGVDTPEVHTENTPGEFEGIPSTSDGETCLGYEGEVSSAVAKSRLLGERVTLKFDSEADRRGYYGRLLAYVYLDGENFNYQLIENGHARVYDSTFSQSDSFYSAESDAQNAGVGVWACTSPSSELGGISIEKFNPDPAGYDSSNLNDEFVVVQNRNTGSADLGGYTLYDDAWNSFAFPSSLSLDSGETVTVHTGSGSDSSAHVYGDYESPIWNNDGDTATLYDDGGDYVVSRSY
ncbi:lamin tail domain-containing protein [Halorussus halophilus]|uniref:lamin tail domain-containing protein n=1 Tax=Halorussus halophilus TaxID=2650975 RepID=UPI001CE458B8|nr:lamin tail domain-containing protein [Halorussus halophilus]